MSAESRWSTPFKCPSCGESIQHFIEVLGIRGNCPHCYSKVSHRINRSLGTDSDQEVRTDGGHSVSGRYPDECEECGVEGPGPIGSGVGGEPLRAIKMKAGGREMLCVECFVKAVEEGRVDESDPRVETDRLLTGTPGAPGQDADPDGWIDRPDGGNGRDVGTDSDQEVRTDGGLDVRDTTTGERELLYALADTDAPVTASEAQALVPDEYARRETVRVKLNGLTNAGWLESDRRPTEGRGRHPLAYSLTEPGLEALTRHVEARVKAVLDHFQAWETVVEREDRSPERVVDDAFCPTCGQVYAGDGKCPECEAREGVIA